VIAIDGEVIVGDSIHNLSRLMNATSLFSNEIEVGWPERVDSVSQQSRDRATWLNRGTHNQPARPFFDILRIRLGEEAPERFERALGRVISGHTDAGDVLENEARYWTEQFRTIVDSLNAYPEIERLSPETMARKRRAGVPVPEKIGEETRQMINELTYAIVPKRDE
jgi:hypothetical protein